MAYECFFTIPIINSNNQRRPCQTNADCPYGGICRDDLKGRCYYPFPLNVTSLIECIMPHLHGSELNLFKRDIGGKTTMNSIELTQSYKDKFQREQCWSESNQNFPLNQTACSVKLTCNVAGSNCPPNTGFCVDNSTCTQNGVCKQVSGVNTQNDCLNSGFCESFGAKIPGTNDFFTKQTCENGTFKVCASNPNCFYSNGVQSCNCTNVCNNFLGLSATEDICLVGPTIITPTSFFDTISCPGFNGQTIPSVGCPMKGLNESECINKGGRFYPMIKTKEECQNIQVCVTGEGTLTNYDSVECGKTGGKMQKLGFHEWQPGMFNNAKFYSTNHWVMSKNVSEYLWINYTDATLFFLIPQFRFGYYSTMAGVGSQLLRMDLTESIACDCFNPDKKNTTNCYPDSYTYDRLTFDALHQTPDFHTTESFTIRVFEDSISSQVDASLFRVKVTTGKVSSSTPFYDIMEIMFQNVSSGKGISNGVSIIPFPDSTIPFKFRVCLPKLNITLPSSYKYPGFAKLGPGGEFFNVGLKVWDYVGEMCADVQAPETYYAAYFDTDVVPSPSSLPVESKGPVSSSTTIIIGLFSLVLAFLIHL